MYLSWAKVLETFAHFSKITTINKIVWSNFYHKKNSNLSLSKANPSFNEHSLYRTVNLIKLLLILKIVRAKTNAFIQNIHENGFTPLLQIFNTNWL